VKKSKLKKPKPGNSNALGWILGIGGGLAIAGIVAVGVSLSMNTRNVDRASGCPSDRYDSVTAVMIDLTDPLNPVQGAAMRNALMKVRDSVPKFGRLEIYPLASTASSAIKPVFAACSPGKGSDVSSRLYGNPELMDRIWRRSFGDKIDEIIKQLRQLPPGDSSPILEGIQSVTVTAFGAPIARDASEKQLVLISDMIQHNGDYSFYEGAPAFSAFRKEPYYLRIKPDLRQAEADVFLIVRETRKNVQQPPLYAFWVEFFEETNGNLRDWEPLQ
jgi:hypothetical protein